MSKGLSANHPVDHYRSSAPLAFSINHISTHICGIGCLQVGVFGYPRVPNALNAIWLPLKFVRNVQQPFEVSRIISL